MKAKGSLEEHDLTFIVGKFMLLAHAREAVIAHLSKYDIRLENFVHDSYTLSFPDDLTAEHATIIKAELEMMFAPPPSIPGSVLLSEWKKPWK